ncbi:MAG: hypothetical protein ACOYMA_10300 [Bacteroidia bacterium]
MKNLLTLLLLIVFGSMAYAQDTNPTPPAPAAASNPTTNSVSKKGLGIGVSLSTNGIGAQISYSLLSSGKLILRAEGNYLNYNLKDYKTNFSGKNMVLNGSIKFGSAGLYADWHPFGNSFKMVLGCAVLLNSINSVAQLKDSIKQGEIMISPSEIGKITFEGKPTSVAPYIGLGFGRSVPKRRLGVSFEVGTYFIGEPSVSFNADGMLEPTSSQETVLSNNLKEYKWLPKLSIGINIKLTK